MTEYDLITAHHYAAWRPPLHDRILALGLRPERGFARALDVGCGTGHSSRALTRFCAEVIGLDPSLEMLAGATAQSGLNYFAQGDGLRAVGQKFEPASFDVFSFAGSLNYQSPEYVLEEMVALAKPGAIVVVYDFEVQLTPVFNHLGKSMLPGDYDHRKNFDSVDDDRLKKTTSIEKELLFTASPEQVAHLLFSVRSWRESVFSNVDFFALKRLLQPVAMANGTIELEAKIYLTCYIVNPNGKG